MMVEFTKIFITIYCEYLSDLAPGWLTRNTGYSLYYKKWLQKCVDGDAEDPAQPRDLRRGRGRTRSESSTSTGSFSSIESMELGASKEEELTANFRQRNDTRKVGSEKLDCSQPPSSSNFTVRSRIIINSALKRPFPQKSAGYSCSPHVFQRGMSGRGNAGHNSWRPRDSWKWPPYHRFHFS